MQDIRRPLIDIGDGERWFAATDVAKAVGYRDAATLTRLVPDDRVRVLTGSTPGGRQRLVFIAESGVATALGKSRSPRAVGVAQSLGIEVHRASPVETATLGIISSALAHMPHRMQYRVNFLRIDLYFLDAKIAVECDEPRHVGKQRSADDERQALLEEALGCVFVRYMPMSKGFNVGRVINQILRLAGH